MQEQDKSLGFLKTGLKVPAAGDLQLGEGSGFVPAENMQESGQDAVGMDGEIARCREGSGSSAGRSQLPEKALYRESDGFRTRGVS